jgi:DNA-binding NarL/FixJ family response regulator
MSTQDSTWRSRPRICLLGNSVLDRAAYLLLLRHEFNHEVTVESDFTPTAVWAAMRCKPNLVLADADGAAIQAVDAVQMIVRLQPAARILVMGTAVDPFRVRSWARCRIHGYVVKAGGTEELRAALTAVLDQRQYFSEGVRQAIRHGTRPADSTEPKLSRRETELLPLLARGLTLREAAQQMTVSYKTADSYRTSLLRKLGLRDRVELARYAIRERIIEP